MIQYFHALHIVYNVKISFLHPPSRCFIIIIIEDVYVNDCIVFNKCMIFCYC